MPAVSRRQQRYLAAKFGADWLRRHHFDELDRRRKRRKPKPKK